MFQDASSCAKGQLSTLKALADVPLQMSQWENGTFPVLVTHKNSFNNDTYPE